MSQKKSRRRPGRQKNRSIYGRVQPDFVELVRELVSTLVCFERAHKAAVAILTSCRENKSPSIDPLLDPLVLACLDAAHAIKEMANTKHFSFIDKHDPTKLLYNLDRARAKKRHPQKFISNTINAGKAHKSGVRVCYGKSGAEWMCQLVFFDGASGEGHLSPLPKGFVFHEDWNNRVQLVYFIGQDHAVNLSLLLYNFKEFTEKLLDRLIDKNNEDGNTTLLYHLQAMQRSMVSDITDTIYFTLIDTRNP